MLEYLWKAAWSFFDKGEPAAEEWVAAQARKILHGKAAQVAAGIRRRATTYGYSPGRARRRRRVRPLAPGLVLVVPAAIGQCRDIRQPWSNHGRDRLG